MKTLPSVSFAGRGENPTMAGGGGRVQRGDSGDLGVVGPGIVG